MNRWLWLAVTILSWSAAEARGQGPAPQSPADLSNQARAEAQDTVLDRKVRDVASMLRCPVCLNLSVYDSPSEMARDMRDVVRDHLKAGETEEQVFNYYIQRYGDWILMKPPAHGVSLFVWLLPAVVVIGGAAVIFLAVRRGTRQAAPAGTMPAAVSEEDMRRIRAELAKGQDDHD